MRDWEREGKTDPAPHVAMVADIAATTTEATSPTPSTLPAVARDGQAVVREGSRLIETARGAWRTGYDSMSWLRLELRGPSPAPSPFTAAILIDGAPLIPWSLFLVSAPRSGGVVHHAARRTVRPQQAA